MYITCKRQFFFFLFLHANKLIIYEVFCTFPCSVLDDGGSDKRLQQSLENDALDAKYGFNRYKESQEIVGWLLNMHPVSYDTIVCNFHQFGNVYNCFLTLSTVSCDIRGLYIFHPWAEPYDRLRKHSLGGGMKHHFIR